MRNVLHVTGVNTDVTYAELEIIMDTLAGSDAYNAVFFDEDDGSLENFLSSVNILPPDTSPTNFKPQRFMIDGKGWFNIINNMASLRKNYLSQL